MAERKPKPKPEMEQLAQSLIAAMAFLLKNNIL